MSKVGIDSETKGAIWKETMANVLADPRNAKMDITFEKCVDVTDIETIHIVDKKAGLCSKFKAGRKGWRWALRDCKCRRIVKIASH